MGEVLGLNMSIVGKNVVYMYILITNQIVVVSVTNWNVVTLSIICTIYVYASIRMILL